MTPAKILLFIISLFPVIWLVIDFFGNQLGVNPVETLIRSTGLWALRFLWITLAITPLRWLTSWNWLTQFRRMMGLYVFFYASVHVLLYLGLEQTFILTDIIRDIIKRPFITVGFFSYIALIPLVITSHNRVIRYLGGRRWKKLHRLIYLISIASAIHFYMLVKLDKSEPVFYAALLALLLLIRIFHLFKSKFNQRPSFLN